MRSLALATGLTNTGWSCVFASRPGSTETVPTLGSGDLEILDMPDDASEQPAALRVALPEGVALLVVDNYGLDSVFEMACRSWAKRVMVIDDLADRKHDSDILLDQTFGRDKADYRSLVPGQCDIFTGANYALLRPEFSAGRLAALARRDTNKSGINRILVSLGASDPHNITSLALEGIRQSGVEAAVDVVLGSGAQYLNKISRLVEGLPQARLHINVIDMASLMADADIAIGAGGTTSWERCCLGLPTLAVTDAENQEMILDGLATVGAITNLGWFADLKSESVAHTLRLLDTSPSELMNMSLAARAICDGQGTRRVMEHICHLFPAAKNAN